LWNTVLFDRLLDTVKKIFHEGLRTSRVTSATHRTTRGRGEDGAKGKILKQTD
jgi:hypothetical protein